MIGCSLHRGADFGARGPFFSCFGFVGDCFAGLFSVVFFSVLVSSKSFLLPTRKTKRNAPGRPDATGFHFQRGRSVATIGRRRRWDKTKREPFPKNSPTQSSTLL